MKITKSQLKQIIKEELEVTLTNEEVAEMFGDEILAEVESDDGAPGFYAPPAPQLSDEEKLDKLDSLVSKASLHAKYDEWNSVKGVIQSMEDVLGRWDPKEWRHTYRKE
jgi:hypothetical protein